MRKVFVLSVALFFAFSSFSQVRKIPTAVNDAFAKQYPNASNVKYEDYIVTVHVHFDADSAKMTAKYNSDGQWKETEREWVYDSLSTDVKDGFQKSKYSVDWRVSETAIIYLPKDELRYRVKVEKNDLQKKYLFFDKNGRLIREALTI
jgi:hypothetical protein